MPKRTVEETIEYFELLASEFGKKADREQDELAKAQHAAKSEAYELAAFELQHNMQQNFNDAVAFFDSVECNPWPGDCSKESDRELIGERYTD